MAGERDFERRVAALSPAKRALLAARLAEGDAAAPPAGADPTEDKRLVAYVVTRTGREARPGELRAFLRVRLPEPMVPAAFVTLPALPRTPSGKIDRRALPAPDPQHRGPILTPDDPETERLAALWAEVLGVEAVGEDDDFFELGGDSILVLKLCARARELDLPLNPKAVYLHPTIAELIAAGPEARQGG
jgi:aryl carrier-like protein